MSEPTPEELREQFCVTERTLLAFDKVYHLMTREVDDAVGELQVWLLEQFEPDELATILCQMLPAQVMGMLAMNHTPE